MIRKIKINSRGFTLIELVIVVAILSILAAVTIPRFSATRKRAAITAHNVNVRTLSTAAHMYIADKGVPKEKVVWDKDKKEDANGWKDYLQEWPKIPSGLTSKDFGISTDQVDYIVTINADGNIEVEPDEIRN